MMRSCLYVPGDRPAMLAKAAGRGADMLILDLEDAVAPSSKAEARTILAEAIPELLAAGSALAVRVNSEPEEQEADLAAIAGTGIEMLVVAKATADGIRAVTERSRETGLSSLRLIALIESAQGLWEALPIARHPWVVNLATGEEDLAADLGVDYRGDPMLWHPVRSRLVWASAAAGLPGPNGPVWTAIRDLEGLIESTLHLKRCGFSSRSAIHPAQVPVINEVFTPSPQELESARQMVDAYDQALSEGRGAILDAQGKMIDEAIVRRARRLVGGQ